MKEKGKSSVEKRKYALKKIKNEQNKKVVAFLLKINID